MVRRVKAYLANLKVNTDEEVLRQLSLECEGGSNPSGGATGGGGSAAGSGSVTLRRRQPSPTLSTASSNSQTSIQSDPRKPKFGTSFFFPLLEARDDFVVLTYSSSIESLK